MSPTTSPQKVRRDALEGKRAQGRQLQLLHKVRRAAPSRVRVPADDPTPTAFAGLIGIGRRLRQMDIDKQLRRHDVIRRRGRRGASS